MNIATPPREDAEAESSTSAAQNEAKAEPSSGAVRSKDGDGKGDGKPLGPVKAACLHCRLRKSRCNGKRPCAACINRGRTDDCIYTISRRGGKPKAKGTKMEPLESHLEALFGLSELPHTVRIPSVVPQLRAFQDEAGGFDFLNPLQAIGNVNAGGIDSPAAPTGNMQMFSAPAGLLPQHHATSSLGNPMATSPHGARFDLSRAPSVQSIIGDYYTYFYRFLPILPSRRYHDVMSTSLTENSPLLLALRCVVPILRDQPCLAQAQVFESDDARKNAIRLEAQYYARMAYDSIDESLERAESQPDKEEASFIEVIQALCILVIYEYGSGRALKSRLKVDAALTLAMSKGLHRLSPMSRTMSANVPSIAPSHYLNCLPEEEVYETKKRLWWTLWMLAMWTAYNTGRIPTVRADDSRITCELPQSSNPTTNLWSYVITSLQALLLVQDRVLALAHIEHGRVPSDDLKSTSASPATGLFTFGSPSTSSEQIPQTFSAQSSTMSREDILRSMNELDAAMQEQMRLLEQMTQGIVGPGRAIDHAEDELQRVLKFLWAIQVYTTSLTLHIGQAFQGASLFERKLCFLSSISEANDAAACQVPMPNAFDQTHSRSSTASEPVAMAPGQDLYARGPFLPRDSLARCVDASDKLLSISRNLRQSEGNMASPNPFNACSFVLISFVCLMQALAISPGAMVTSGDEWNAGSVATGMDLDSQQRTEPSQSSLTASTLLRNAQSAAALTPATLANGISLAGEEAAAPTPPLQAQPAYSMSILTRQAQLQQIWARVKEAKDALQGLSKYWDMVIPMRDEVSGCLEASQFLLSQQPLQSANLSAFNASPSPFPPS